MIEEDYEAWEAYPHHRWLFNKLEVSQKFGYECGPACVPIKKTGNYIIRPIYNLYGMGIGAHKKFLDVNIHAEEMIHHKHIPPGYFWCEWFDGNHYSIDYKWVDEGKGGIHSHWEPFCCVIGTHNSVDNLTKFKEWEIIDPSIIAYDILPDWIHDIETEKYLNIETKEDKIIEIHLRSGNDVMWDYGLGTKFFPAWKGVEYKEYEGLKFLENFHKDSFIYEADGNLSDIRLGYYVNEKI